MYKKFSLYLILLLLLSACSSIKNDSGLLHEEIAKEEKKNEDNSFEKETLTRDKSHIALNETNHTKKDKKRVVSKKKLEIDTKESREKDKKDTALTYTYEFIIEGLDSDNSDRTNEGKKADKLNAEQELLKHNILDLFRKNSQLEFLKKDPIESIVGLERRARIDVNNAIKVMEAYGFYSSSAKFDIDETAKPYKVFVYLYPHDQYLVNNININYIKWIKIPPDFSEKKKNVGFLYRKQVKKYSFEFPHELSGIKKGDKAVAENISSAVNNLAKPFRNYGFPRAVVTSSAYTVNKKTKELNGNVSVNQGFPAFLGNVVVSGNQEVSSKFIKDLHPWKYGEIWDERKLLEYRKSLQATGLFQKVDLRLDEKIYREYVKKARKDRKKKNSAELKPATLPVLLTVEESTARSLSGALSYSTDQGPGMNISWEHRNFFGNGERLLLNMPLSKEEALFSGELRKPAFVFPKQTLILRGSGGYEDTDAYEHEFIDIGLGLEREIRQDWWIESLVHLDRVNPKNDDNELDYSSLRWVNSVRYDKRDNRQNPTKGFVGLVRFSPLLGYDDSSFYSMGMEFDGSIYHSLTEKILLATRLGLGVMPGSDEGKIPRAKRFFLGGGGTVRGFSYQELGRHDADNDPLGGRSYTLMNFEARIKINKEISIVPFVDSGMVYDEITPKWDQDLAWGAGIGVRYATPVGPVRVDIAVPLTDPNKTTKKSLADFQIYISIGQAF